MAISGLKEESPTSIQARKESDQFDEWWQRSGKYLDPDTSEVSWHDKRKELAALAYVAGMAQSRNHIADAAVSPTIFHFKNGVTVSIQYEGDTPYLHILKP